MSQLWARAAALQVDGMAWTHQYGDRDPRKYTPIHVRDAGFAGYVGDSEDDAEMRDARGEEDENGWDEDLYERTSPDPTSRELRHHSEHGEMPQSYYDRHDDAYARAQQQKKQEDVPDIEDPALRRFTSEHGANTKLWHDYGRTGKVNLDQPVYATQTHVAEEHIRKYYHQPGATSHHEEMHGRGAGGHYLGNEHPMFVTHEGRLHVIEGHHRVAAEFRNGSKEMYGHHFNLDEHPQFGEPESEEYELWRSCGLTPPRTSSKPRGGTPSASSSTRATTSTRCATPARA